VGKFTTHHPVSGLVTYDPRRAGPAAKLAQRLGLPGNAPAAVTACQDPEKTRWLLEDFGVPSTLSLTVDDDISAVSAACQLHFPVTVKAAGGGACVRADSVDDVRAAFRTIREDRGGGPCRVTVDQFGAGGPAVGVEAVIVASDDVRTIAVTRADTRPELPSSPLGYSVDANDELLRDAALSRLVARAVTALGLTVGVVHAEVRLTPSGPRLLRIDAGPADDLIPLLVDRATGVNLARAAAALATGATPDLAPSRERACAIRFLFPDTTGRLVRLKAPAAFTAQPWLDRFAWTQQPGNAVLGPPLSDTEDRLAHWVVTGVDRAECDVRLGLTAEQVTARISRLASSPVGTC
jgi:biotin carboxylase